MLIKLSLKYILTGMLLLLVNETRLEAKGDLFGAIVGEAISAYMDGSLGESEEERQARIEKEEAEKRNALILKILLAAGAGGAIYFFFFRHKKPKVQGYNAQQATALSPVNTLAEPMGQILSYNAETKTGVISTTDGKRYNFTAAEVKGEESNIVRGAKIDFTPDDQGNALDIYPFGQKPKLLKKSDVPSISVPHEKDDVKKPQEERINLGTIQNPVEKLLALLKRNKKRSISLFTLLFILPGAGYTYNELRTVHFVKDQSTEGRSSYCLDQLIQAHEYMKDMAALADSDGNVHMKYKNNRMDEGIIIYNNGRPNESETWDIYEEGKRIGRKVFHPNGRLRVSFDMINGQVVDGKVKFYDDKGKVEDIVTFSKANGAKQKKLFPNGQLASEKIYTAEGALDKKSTWHENAQLKCETNYQGDYIYSKVCYFQDGNIQSSHRATGGADAKTKYAWYGSDRVIEMSNYQGDPATNSEGSIATQTQKDSRESTRAVHTGYHQSVNGYREQKYEVEYYVPNYGLYDNETKNAYNLCDKQLKQGLAMVYNLPQGTPGTQTINSTVCMSDISIRHGAFKEFAKGGQIIKEAHYSYGELDGNVKEWDANGTLISNSLYDKGAFVGHILKKQ